MPRVAVEVLRERHGGRVVALGGALAGHRVLLREAAPGPVLFAERPATLRRAAVLRARQIQGAHLDRRQRGEARASGGLFWEHTPLGWFRLGRRYDIRYRPSVAPASEQSICVVTEDLDVVPDDDLWLNLLLVLRVAPSEFLEIALVVTDDSTIGDRPQHDVRDRERLRLLTTERERCWQAGEYLGAAFVDFTIGHLHRAWANPVTALPHAVRAAVTMSTLGTVLTAGERTRWLAAHSPVFDLLASVTVKDPSGQRGLTLARQAFATIREDLLRGPALDTAESDLRAWMRAVILVDRTFRGCSHERHHG